jgi:hypothetical protein
MKLKQVSFNNEIFFKSCSEYSPGIYSHFLVPLIIKLDFILVSVAVLLNIICDVQHFWSVFLSLVLCAYASSFRCT